MRAFHLRWLWLLGPLLPAYAVGVPLLFLLLDRGLRAAGASGANPWVLGGAVTLGTVAVLANARRDRLVVGPDGLRLSEGDTPVDLVAPWSAVREVRRARRGPVTVDMLVVADAKLVRREPGTRASLRGPLRERAFQREHARRREAGRPEVVLTKYGKGGWDGPLGDVVRQHRPDLVLRMGPAPPPVGEG